MDVDFGGLDWIVLIMDRSGRACQIIYFIDFYIERKGNVVA